MTNKAKPEPTLERLKDVLDANGPDKADWPEDERAALAALSEGSDEGRQLFAAARALSRLLNEAREPTVSGALAARIIEAAGHAGTNQPDNVVPLRRGAKEPAPERFFAPHLPQAALLAASLLIGVWAGVSGTVDGLIVAPLELAGLVNADETMLFGSGLDVNEDLL